MDATSVDVALDRLRRPTTVDDRLQTLRQIVEYWHGEIGAEDGYAQETLQSARMPRALNWWYRWAGLRSQIMRGQNFLLSPEDLKIVDERLLIQIENQSVFTWATLPDGDDPPVFGRYEEHQPWQREDVSLSEHLILTCIFEAIMNGSFGVSAACLDGRTLSRFEKIITPVAIQPWHWNGPTQFYAKGGLFMCSMCNGTEEYSVWVGAKDYNPLRFIERFLDDRWEKRESYL